MPLHRLFDSGLPGQVSRAIGIAADLPIPQRVLGPLIGAYSLAVGVDRSDVDVPPGGFPTFGDFFARRLKAGARPVSNRADAFAAPCDGAIAASGEADGGGSTVFRIKGSDYGADELLGGSGEGARFAGGGYLVVYLHPRDYHRVHAPCRGALTRVRHVPGRRFPVAPWSEKRVPLLYQKNERAIFFFDLDPRGALALVMVAAMGVGNIASPHAPPPAPCGETTRALSPALELAAGDEVGAFRLGSTVVLLWSAGAVNLGAQLSVGQRVLQGQELGAVGTIGS
ncbi:MAG: archaetidylserine decarboxylase [Proteobacteria bacterium]|nr:archaetidylserine decarboxylase [Pseudomonadota bacterium]